MATGLRDAAEEAFVAGRWRPRRAWEEDPHWILAECTEVRDLLQDAVEGTESRLVFHGHWHRTIHEHTGDGNTEVFALNLDGLPGNVAVLDLGGDGLWRDLAGFGCGGISVEPGDIDDVVHGSRSATVQGLLWVRWPSPR